MHLTIENIIAFLDNVIISLPVTYNIKFINLGIKIY